MSRPLVLRVFALPVLAVALAFVLLEQHELPRAEAVQAAPTNVNCVNQAGNDQSPGISFSGGELFMGAVVGGGNSSIYVAQSQASPCPWSSPVFVGSLNTGHTEHSPDLTGDSLTIYFLSTRLSFGPRQDLFYATRPVVSAADNWSAPQAIAELNCDVSGCSLGNDSTGAPSVSSDNLTLYFTRDPDDPNNNVDFDSGIWVSTRPNTGSPWGAPAMVAALNSPSNDTEPDISQDGKTIYFASDRPGGQGGLDLWGAYSPLGNGVFGAPVNLGAVVNSPVEDTAPSVGSDGRTIYFQSTRPGGLGGSDVWAVTLEDGDGDGAIDLLDNCSATSNPMQEDRDADGLGDVCDPQPAASPSFGALDCHTINYVFNLVANSLDVALLIGAAGPSLGPATTLPGVEIQLVSCDNQLLPEDILQLCAVSFENRGALLAWLFGRTTCEITQA